MANDFHPFFRLTVNQMTEVLTLIIRYTVSQPRRLRPCRSPLEGGTKAAAFERQHLAQRRLHFVKLEMTKSLEISSLGLFPRRLWPVDGPPLVMGDRVRTLLG